MESLQDVAVQHAGTVTTDDLNQLGTAVDAFFVQFSAYLVFIMQLGFAMLTGGSVRTKNTKNVLLKNSLDLCVTAFTYYLVGYAFAFGSEGNVFIGHSNFALSSLPTSQYSFFLYQWAFAAATATIVSGSVAERTSFTAYLMYAAFLTGWVYPLITHWAWDENGWMGAFYASPLLSAGYHDFAGSGCVHMTGGFSGLAGAIIVGPRMGRFDADGNVMPMPGHSASLIMLGTFVLWFGWYGFNPGSSLGVSKPGLLAAAQLAAMNSTLSASSAALTTLLVIRLRDGCYDLIATLNGLLAGLVAITAPCYGCEPYGAIAIGAVAALVYISCAALLLKLKIDDPLEAFPIHGGAGMWGVISVGLFTTPWNQFYAYETADHAGAFYGGGGRLLACQIIGALVIAGWTLANMVPFFLILRVSGLMRISPEDEVVGMDVTHHGGECYPEDKMSGDPNKMDHDNFGMDESPCMPDSPARKVVE